MSLDTQVANLLKQARLASTLAEQQDLVRQAEMLKSQQHEAAFGSGDWSAEDARIRDTLVPGFTHERVTASTDWLLDVERPVDTKQATNSMVAEASIWFTALDDEAKSYRDEFDERAKNLARKLSGQYGDYADTAERTFLDEANRLRTTAVRSGLVVEAGDAGETPESTKAPEQKKYEKLVEGDINKEKDGNTKSFETKAASYEDEADDQTDPEDDSSNPFATTGMHRAAARDQQAVDLFDFLAASSLPEVTQQGYPTDQAFANSGTNSSLPPEATSSNRAPAIQELQSNSQDVVPVNDPGLGQTDDLTGANATRSGEQDHASKNSFPVSGKKESSMAQQFGQCPTCGGHGKVAKTAASGLPQIDQIVDSHDNASTTPYPSDVAFPWVLNPAAQVPAAINQAEQQIAQRNSLSPTQQSQSRQAPSRQSVQSSVTAGGRDNSGWMGDNGARGLDYPGEQIGQYPQPTDSLGYSDPAHGHGGDVGNRPAKPYGAMEEHDYTSNPGQNWQPGQPTQDDNGWREVQQGAPINAQAAWKQTVENDEALKSAYAYINSRFAAHQRAQ